MQSETMIRPFKPKDLVDMGPEELGSLEPAELAEMQAGLLSSIKANKLRMEILEQALVARYGDRIRKNLLESKRDTGTTHLEDGGIGIEVNVPKKVDWDQEKLSGVLNAMSPEDAKHYAKVAITVGEREFSAAPPDIKAKLKGCRTVTPGKPKIVFEQLAG